tara:strand:- start:430 stop:627 length:198 start_codon:yes stop_codon:yes gene_type:complete
VKLNVISKMVRVINLTDKEFMRVSEMLPSNTAERDEALCYEKQVTVFSKHGCVCFVVDYSGKRNN